jgi:diguanylate cyclase (GGDEF)-like protein/PAS domain S-box-containing protein
MTAILGATEADTRRTVGHILIIDDDEVSRLLDAMSLQHSGWTVSQARSGREGLALAAAELPEVIICDRRLPDINGIEVIAALASDPLTASIPIVLVTGMGESGDIVAGIDAGAHDYLVKPFKMVELEVRCRAALRVSRQHRLLARSEHELRLLSDNTTDLVMRCGIDGLIRYVSLSVRRLLGFEPDSLVGRPAAWLCHPDDTTALGALPDVLAGEVASVTCRIVRVDGSYLWVESRAQIIEGPDGDLEVLTSARDITEQLATAAALEESGNAYRRIVDLAAEGICVADSDQRITFANAQMGKLLGVPAAELLGRSTLEYTDAEGRAFALAGMDRRRAGIAESGDFRFVRPDGSAVWTSFNAAPIIDDDGVFRGSIELVSDITERHAHEEAVARSEARYRTLIEHLPDTVAIVYDRQMRAVIAAGAGLTPRGLNGADMVGRHFDELVATEDNTFLDGICRSAFDREPTSTEFHSHLTGVDNLLDVVPVPAVGGGDPIEILVLLRNVGALKERERALTAAEQRWRTAFDQAPVGMAQVGIDGRFLRVNPALCDMVGYSAEELQATTPVDISHPDDAECTRRAISDVADNTVGHFRDERRYLHATGRILWCAVSAVAVHDGNGRVDHLLIHYLDISELKRIEAQLQHLSTHDPLTGLLNRRGFQEALESHVAHVDRYGPDGALFVIDLDGLKAINDTHGHSSGDRAITAAANVLRRLRSTDTIGRLGGDEFAVIIHSVDRVLACRLAGSLVKEIRNKSASDDPVCAVTASVGVAMFDHPIRTADKILRDADSTMYAAKSAGRDRYAIEARR